MPFSTYAIDPRSFENLQKVNFSNFSDFTHHVNDLNSSKRMILIDDASQNIEKIIEKKHQQIVKIINPNILMQKEILEKLYKAVNNTFYKYKIELPPGYNFKKKLKKKKIRVDFFKNSDNKFQLGEWKKAKTSGYGPKNFNYSIKQFEKDFLDKIKMFLISYKQKNKQKIDSFMIFNKELSNYLIPKINIKEKNIYIIHNRSKYKSIMEEAIKDPLYWKDPQKRKFYIQNVEKKIRTCINILFRWWKNLPIDIKPNKFVIISSIKGNQKDYKVDLELNMKQFLFGGYIDEKFPVSVKLFSEDELKKGTFDEKSKKLEKSIGIFNMWQHLRHYVFGEKLNFVIFTDLGAEFVDPNNPSRLYRKAKWLVFDKKADEASIRDIKKAIRLLQESYKILSNDIKSR
jgi:hypothetical protein|tara:strand:- start:951 stop:2153 length:1203 start_codon:yes stop_codon:yes gene_type:complete